MKNTITLTFFILGIFFNTSQAQENTLSTNKHLSFKGVPINGTLNEYVSKMEEKGFESISEEDRAVVLQGDFASYKDCTIGVFTLDDLNLVSQIKVIFPECETWASLSKDYFYLKELLLTKYGNPSDVKEEFQSNAYTKDDNFKMAAVRMNTCSYYTTFELENGTIQLSIENQNNFASVMLIYTDRINGDRMRAKAIDDL